MKKRIVETISVMLAAALLSGCGKSSKNGEITTGGVETTSAVTTAEEELKPFKGNGSIGNSEFFVEFNSYTGAINKLICQGDGDSLNYVMGTDRYSYRNSNGDKWFGDVDISVSRDGSDFKEITTAVSSDIRTVSKIGKSGVQVAYSGKSGAENGLDGISLVEEYRLDGDELQWTTEITNTSDTKLTLGAVSFPMMFNSAIAGTQEQMYEEYVYSHSYISYNDTYFYVGRNSGNGPLLLLYTKGDTSVEYQYWRGNSNCASMYTVAGNTQEQYPNSAYLGLSTKELAPGEKVTYTFGMRWADTTSDIVNELYEAGKTGIVSLPGMVIPTDMTASVAFRTEKEISAVSCEFADETNVKSVGKDGNGYNKYEINFSHLGQNKVNVVYSDGTKGTLLYFVTEPLEELIEKNTDFISENQQQTDPSDECYMGFLPWDMVMNDLAGDGLLDGNNFKTKGYFPTGWWHYGGDEMGFSPALYLSLKNVYDPDEGQIKQLVDYINIFIYDKMTERFKDGTYRLHRGAPWYIMGEWDGDTRIDRKLIRTNADCWRPYNYPHVINTYYNMYRIASYYDFDIEGMLDAKEYLKRAYDLCYTFFTAWMYPKGEDERGEGGIHFGNMGETMFFEIAEQLKNEGMTDEYNWLKGQLDAKAEYFANEKYPYSSESAFDTAAYESVLAYALYSGNTALADEVTKTNLATRGQTPVWYLYGSDLPNQDKAVNLRYMTQLGGWSVLLHALNGSGDVQDELRIAYGSYLAGWSLINSGYYSENQSNIGSSVWYYQGIKGNTMDSVNSWEQILPIYNGAIAVSGESALGFWAGLSMACSVVTDDDVFGRYAYGGVLREKDGVYTLTPNDGVRKRIYVLTNGRNCSVSLLQDKIKTAAINTANEEITLVIENSSGISHTSTAEFEGISGKGYKAYLDGEEISFDGNSVTFGMDKDTVTLVLKK